MADGKRDRVLAQLQEWTATERFVLARAAQVLSFEAYLAMERMACEVEAVLSESIREGQAIAVADDLTDELLSAALRAPQPLDVGVEAHEPVPSALSAAATQADNDPYADLVSFKPDAEPPDAEGDVVGFDLDQETEEDVVPFAIEVSEEEEPAVAGESPSVEFVEDEPEPEAELELEPEPEPKKAKAPVTRVEVAKPAAAVVQIGAAQRSSTTPVVAIAVGSAEDDDEDDFDLPEAQGFTVSRDTLEEDEDSVEADIELAEAQEFEDVGDEPIPTEEAPTGVSPEVVLEIYERAQAAASDGRLEEGAHLYSDVIDADEGHLGAHLARGRLYLDLGDYSRAMSDFMVAEELDAATSEPRVAIGELYFARKDYRKAIECFDSVLEVDPSHAMATCRRGISHYYRKNFAVALEDLRRAQQLNPDIPNVDTYVGLAEKRCR